MQWHSTKALVSCADLKAFKPEVARAGPWPAWLGSSVVGGRCVAQCSVSAWPVWLGGGLGQRGWDLVLRGAVSVLGQCGWAAALAGVAGI